MGLLNKLINILFGKYVDDYRDENSTLREVILYQQEREKQLKIKNEEFNDALALIFYSVYSSEYSTSFERIEDIKTTLMTRIKGLKLKEELADTDQSK